MSREAMEKALVAINDLVNVYVAPDFCSPETRAEARKRIIDNGGSLAYCGDTLAALRAALAAPQEGKP